MAERTIDDAIFNFAYTMAMRDATLQQAFPAVDKKKLWQKDDPEDEKVTEARRKIKELLKGYIDNVYGGKATKSDFYKAEEAIEDAVNVFIKVADIKEATKAKEPPSNKHATFTFGNAQKLINMAAKYMYISLYKRDSELEDLRERFSVCHCPMDGIILQTVVEQAVNAAESGNASDSLEKFVKICAERRPRKKDWVVADGLKWSQLNHNDERYQCFQDAVQELANREGVSPIEFDFMHWN